MKRSFRRLGPLAALLVLAGCSPAMDITTDGGSDDPLDELNRDTGVSWSVRYHTDVHTPAFLQGRTAPLAFTLSDAEHAGRAFLTRYRTLYKMGSPAEELSTIATEVDEFGMMHTRFTQKKSELPIWGGDLVVHFDPSGALVRVNGRYLPIGDVPTVPQRNSAEAQMAAVMDAQASHPGVDRSAFVALVPKLWIYARAADDVHLAWRVETEVNGDNEPHRYQTFIDAMDGSVLHRNDELATLDASGIGVFGDRKHFVAAERKGRYYMEDSTRGNQKVYTLRGRSRLPGTEESSLELTHWDEGGVGAGAAVDAQAHVAAAYDYFFKTHGRAGFAGKGTGVHATVHYGSGYNNAFFNGTQLVFGDGDGRNMSPLSAGLDVVIHEFTHGVTYHTAKLAHEGQPGALNEAISDIFSAFATYAEGAQYAWVEGETIYHPNGHAASIRDMAHPHKTQNPASMDEYQDTDEDSGGVHYNSTIPSHAAYLMTEGTRDFRGIGVELAQTIWYRALTHYLTSHATFLDAADATLAAARDLGKGEAAVAGAWSAVGVTSN